MFLKRSFYHHSSLFFPTFLITQKCKQSTNAVKESAMPIEKVWTLWNEGNLFSLNIAQLQSFLSSQNVQFEVTAKKASLIRQVEEILQARDDKMKGIQPGQQDKHGRWQQSGQQPETLMDLQQAGFYENSMSMAPKAFQLLVTGHTVDLVVSRVNTTSFPGFPSNNECYTLSAAISDLAVRARYSKALQWCVMNMRNLNLKGEFAVDFGKMLLKNDIVKKNRKIVSAWTLQQRAQINDPYEWISTVSEDGIKDLESFLKIEGFTPVEAKGLKQYFDVHIRRKRDVVNLELTSEGKVVNGFDSWYSLQRSHLASQTGGQDVRLQLRTRNPIKPQEMQKISNIPILKITDDAVNSVLPAELGQVVYTSENNIKEWEKKSEKGVVYTLTEIRRSPLIVTRPEDEDDRFEYIITTPIPAVELNYFANQLFSMARRFQDILSPSFVSKFNTEVKPLSFENE